jgi:chorismate mutase/prephenate dehydratase
MTDLADNIEDESSNWTRFVLITAGDMSAQRPRNASQKNFKSSLIFTVSDKAGALSSVLGIFTSHQVNMTKLESRPLRGSCWKYIFFADVECDLTDPYYSGLIQEVSDLCTSVRVLGCYPEGPRLDSTANTTGF